MAADLAVFDPARIQDTASFAKPAGLSRGHFTRARERQVRGREWARHPSDGGASVAAWAVGERMSATINRLRPLIADLHTLTAMSFAYLSA